MNVLKEILDNVSDSVIVIDPSGKILLFNHQAFRLHQSVSETELETGAYFPEIVREERKKLVIEALKTVRRQKKAVKIFAEFKGPSGDNLFLEVSYVPTLGEKKELRYISVIAQDMTSRKIFEKKLKDVTAEVKNVLEHAHAFIFSIDTQGYVVEWNDHCEQLTGYARSEMLSQKVSHLLMSKENVPLLAELMDKVLRKEAVSNFEFPVQTKRCDELIIMLSATPRTNANGRVIGATLVGQDITELTAYRRSLEKQIRNRTAALEQVLRKEKEVVEMKSRFVTIASHEFRSPLSSIDYAANFIKRNAGTIGKKILNEKVEVIEKHVNHMSHLLEDVLTFSKNEKTAIKVVPEKISLDSFLRNAAEEVSCHFKNSHHICISTSELGPCVTDEKLLRNIVINLLTNAIKFSPARDEVFLNVLDKGAFISIEVKDEGIGIPADELDKIFEPFVRGKAVDSIQGTGLGLSIVKKAVDLLQGTIHVESRPRKGSVFKVTLPRQIAFL